MSKVKRYGRSKIMSSSAALPIVDDLLFSSVEQLNIHLLEKGCKKCDLGFQDNINGCCVSRGDPSSSKMIIGEAPGKDEDSTRKPFTGPAGRLMDKIWASVGMDTNDWYLTNVVLCRPVAPTGSGKQNLTPKAEQRKRCRSYMAQQIDLLRPKLIVTVGAIATAAVLFKPSIRMGSYRGVPIHQDFGYTVFPMLHPAAILHAQRDPAKHLQYRQQMWDDIRRLKTIVEENNL
jgi:DNA polymerase